MKRGAGKRKLEAAGHSRRLSHSTLDRLGHRAGARAGCHFNISKIHLPTRAPRSVCHTGQCCPPVFADGHHCQPTHQVQHTGAHGVTRPTNKPVIIGRGYTAATGRASKKSIIIYIYKNCYSGAMEERHKSRRAQSGRRPQMAREPARNGGNVSVRPGFPRGRGILRPRRARSLSIPEFGLNITLARLS